MGLEEVVECVHSTQSCVCAMSGRSSQGVKKQDQWESAGTLSFVVEEYHSSQMIHYVEGGAMTSARIPRVEIH